MLLSNTQVNVVCVSPSHTVTSSGSLITTAGVHNHIVHAIILTIITLHFKLMITWKTKPYSQAHSLSPSVADTLFMSI